jgi:hypothetical protein
MSRHNWQRACLLQGYRELCKRVFQDESLLVIAKQRRRRSSVEVTDAVRGTYGTKSSHGSAIVKTVVISGAAVGDVFTAGVSTAKRSDGRASAAAPPRAPVPERDSVGRAAGGGQDSVKRRERCGDGAGDSDESRRSSVE